nr:uncharacterized protein LOC129445385 [Misgurnus anguillicaudatus]
MMMDVMCCKSVGTDLSMLDIDDFITEISQLKKEVALLETKLRLRGDEGLKREDSELSLTLLCYTESKHTDAQDTTVCDSNQDLQDEESTDQTSTESLDSVCNAGEQQQILQTKLNMCSVKLIDCTNLMMKIKTEPTEIKTEPTPDEYEEDKHNDGHDFILTEGSPFNAVKIVKVFVQIRSVHLTSFYKILDNSLSKYSLHLIFCLGSLFCSGCCQN